MKKLDILPTGATCIAVIAIGIASLVAGAFFLNARVADFLGGQSWQPHPIRDYLPGFLLERLPWFVLNSDSALVLLAALPMCCIWLLNRVQKRA